MTSKLGGVYALVALIAANAAAAPGTMPGKPPHASSAVPAPLGGAKGPVLPDPSRGVDIWWALVELHIRMLCVVLDCEGEFRGTPFSDEEYGSLKDLMQHQVLAYLASGLRPDLTPEEITEAEKSVLELLNAMASAPPELNTTLKEDYTNMLGGVNDDLAGL